MSDKGWDDRYLIFRIDNLLDYNPETVFCKKILCVKLCLLGVSVGKVAEAANVTPRTVENWVHTARQGKLYSLNAKHAGRHTALSLPEFTDLLRAYQNESSEKYGESKWNAKAVGNYIEMNYGIVLAPRTCYKYLAILREYSRDNTDT